jgi:hypothetical protein
MKKKNILVIIPGRNPEKTLDAVQRLNVPIEVCTEGVTDGVVFWTPDDNADPQQVGALGTIIYNLAAFYGEL